MTTIETNQTNQKETARPGSHRLRNFLIGAGALAGSIVVFDAHEVKDPAAGIQVIGAGTGVIEDLTGKDNIYLDWVDFGAIVVGAVGLSVAFESVTRRPDEE